MRCLKQVAGVCLCALSGLAAAEETATVLDKTRDGLQRAITRTAQKLDGLSGVRYADSRYEVVAGSVSIGAEWAEFDGWNQRVRFRVNVPLPGLDARYSAFIGRVDRDEVVTGQTLQRGAGPISRSGDLADQTLAGISFLEPKESGGSFDAGAGVRLRFPLDPYVKGGWRYIRDLSDAARWTLRETAFWEAREGVGLTTQLYLDQVWNERWLATWSTSATISQKSSGVRGYAGLRVLRSLGATRGLALDVSANGETDADVPLEQYGVRGAYRFATRRDWLIVETSVGVNWPRTELDQSRGTSWGVGIGVEMLLGEAKFSPRPVTF
ncbi:MAG TPA: hypothetical protein P5528_00830 [Steroidobacteraceae bacterium]|nr:hypothetical protein [Steroidobacteraceae bacterium]HRX87963.1 hypothetical protein [Steroidobacteraceae bacterium]